MCVNVYMYMYTHALTQSHTCTQRMIPGSEHAHKYLCCCFRCAKEESKNYTLIFVKLNIFTSYILFMHASLPGLHFLPELLVLLVCLCFIFWLFCMATFYGENMCLCVPHSSASCFVLMATFYGENMCLCDPFSSAS